jgi:hypothetical protein
LTSDVASPDHVRLTTRDERETSRTDLALFALASQGVSILIAGLDPTQAESAASFSARTKIPVILLSATGNVNAETPSFLLGDSYERVAVTLTETMTTRGAHTIAPIGGSVPGAVAGRATFLPSLSCDAAPSQAGESKFPVSDWRANRVDHLLLLGDAACAADALADLQAAHLSGVRAVVGLEGAEVADDARAPLLVASAGSFPLKRGDTSSALNGFKKRHGKAPSWFAALGHDAAVLARAALRELPLDRADDKAEVEKRHAAARTALARAQANLWTTEAAGFAGSNAIDREINVIEVR